MQKLLSLILLGTLSVGCTPQTNSSDNYKVEWTGVNGSKLFGSYVIASKNPNTATRTEKITATLPYKVSFSAPKDTLISASGLTLNQGAIEVKIFKNGSECGKVVFTGNGAMANKVCQ